MRADAFGPAAVTGLAWQAPRRSLHRSDATSAALASTENTARRLRAELRDKAKRASSPPCLGSRCGVNCCAIQHNGLLHARPAFRSPSSLQPGMRATPVMSCAHCAPARGIGSGYRAHARRTPKHVRPWLRHRRKGSWSGALRARSSSWPPARPPSAPRGGSLALSTVLAQRSAVLAASRERCRRFAPLTRLRAALLEPGQWRAAARGTGAARARRQARCTGAHPRSAVSPCVRLVVASLIYTEAQPHEPKPTFRRIPRASPEQGPPARHAQR